MKKTAMIIAFAFSCTNDERTTSTLEAEGFHDISLTGYAFSRCGRDDATCTGFEAMSATGRQRQADDDAGGWYS